jgi:nicotinamidase/pyrazinamidase
MTEALLIVDIQNDFLPGGALAVPGGDAIIPVVNALGQRYRNVVLTQDWHPAGHVSFASSHPGRAPFDRIALPYGDQVLWPDHCVQGTTGASLARDLDVPHAQIVVRKGFHADVDSYSAFLEADRRTPTGLAGYLRERGIDRIALAGLALDYCVAWSAYDALDQGFRVTVIEDACQPIDVHACPATLAALRSRGIVTQTFAERCAAIG